MLRSYFIAFVSSEYLASSNCMDELNFARDENKKLLLGENARKFYGFCDLSVPEKIKNMVE